MNRLALGSIGLGFKMKQVKAAIATGNIHTGTITRKLNGAMSATTSSGWRSAGPTLGFTDWRSPGRADNVSNTR